jgi:hypothetical protein
MRSHFDRHRWERSEPKVTVIAVPPPGTEGQDVRAVASGYQAQLRPAGVTLIRPECLHVTLAPVAWASAITDNEYAALRDVLMINMDQYGYLPPSPGRPRLSARLECPWGAPNPMISLRRADLPTALLARLSGNLLGNDQQSLT